MLIVEKPSAAAVARAYDLNVRKLRRWLRETPNASLLGTIDSPAIKGEVERFRRWEALSPTCKHDDDRRLRRHPAYCAWCGALDK